MTNQIDPEVFKKIINESPNKKCECGCEYFIRTTIQKEISALLSGTGKSEILLVEILLCYKCGKESKPDLIIT